MARFVDVLAPARATGEVEAVYESISRTFPGPVPELYRLLGLAPELLEPTWRHTTDCYLASDLDRGLVDAIAAAVSKINECPYCSVAHGELVRFTDRTWTSAILAEDASTVVNARARRLIEWGLSTLDPGAEIIRNPPFGPEEAPEIIGTAVIFHHTNRIVNVFLDPSPIPGPAFSRPLLLWLGRPVMRKLAELRLPRAPALRSSVPPPLPVDLRWAESDRVTAATFLSLAEASEAAGKRVLPDAVRKTVDEHLAGWNGEPAPLGSEWLEDVVEALDSTDKPLARFALLTARSSSTVTAETIAAARSALVDDASLVRAAFWAAFRAARRVGSWLVPQG